MTNDYGPWRLAAQRWLETEVMRGFRGFSLNGESAMSAAAMAAYDQWAAEVKERVVEMFGLARRAIAAVLAAEERPCHQALIASAAETAMAMQMHSDLVNAKPGHMFPMLLVHLAKPYKPMAVYTGNRLPWGFEVYFNDQFMGGDNAPVWGPEAKDAVLKSVSGKIVRHYFGENPDAKLFEDVLVPHLRAASPDGWSISKEDVGKIIEGRLT